MGLTCSATLNVTMFPSPVVVTGQAGVTKYYSIDVDNNGIDDLRFKIFSFGGYEISFESLNEQYLEAEYINSAHAIAYTCGALFGAGSGWASEVYLALEDDDYQFDGKGPRYLAVRKQIGDPPFETYIYGWAKIECAADGSQFILYGYAYQDVTSYNPNVIAGQGECVLNTFTPDWVFSEKIISLMENRLVIDYSEPLQFRVFDASGKLLLSDNLSPGRKEYYLSKAKAGIVLIEIEDGLRTKVFKYLKPF